MPKVAIKSNVNKFSTHLNDMREGQVGVTVYGHFFVRGLYTIFCIDDVGLTYSSTTSTRPAPKEECDMTMVQVLPRGTVLEITVD